MNKHKRNYTEYFNSEESLDLLSDNYYNYIENKSLINFIIYSDYDFTEILEIIKYYYNISIFNERDKKLEIPE